ncbi:hypothetical protein ABIA29_000878 [Bradyrhizobium japonicum]
MLSARPDCFKDLRDELPVTPRGRRPVPDRPAGLGCELVGDEAARPVPFASVDFGDPQLDRPGCLVRDPWTEQQSRDPGAARHSGGSQRGTSAHDGVLGPGCGRCALSARGQGRRARLHHAALGRDRRAPDREGHADRAKGRRRPARTDWPCRDPEPDVDRLDQWQRHARRRHGHPGRDLLGREHHLYSRASLARLPASAPDLAGVGGNGGAVDHRGNRGWHTARKLVVEARAAVPLFRPDRDGACLLGDVDGQQEHLGADDVARHHGDATRRHRQCGGPAGRADRLEPCCRGRTDRRRHRPGNAPGIACCAVRPSRKVEREARRAGPLSCRAGCRRAQRTSPAPASTRR